MGRSTPGLINLFSGVVVLADTLEYNYSADVAVGFASTTCGEHAWVQRRGCCRVEQGAKRGVSLEATLSVDGPTIISGTLLADADTECRKLCAENIHCTAFEVHQHNYAKWKKSRSKWNNMKFVCQQHVAPITTTSLKNRVCKRAHCAMKDCDQTDYVF